MGRLISLVPAIAIACVRPGTVVCADGSICPAGTTCAALTDPDQIACATPEQIAACRDLDDLAPCDLGDGTTGACHDGVCLEVECGNARVDPGESCDDGGNVSGDGCAADCTSDESCGNGVHDAITGEQCDDGDLASNDGCTSRCRLEQPAWTPLVGDVPDARILHSATYDPVRGHVVLFGGLASGSVLGDMWTWDGATWARSTPLISPPPRTRHATAYDVGRGRLVMFGGVTGNEAADTWEFDGVAWTVSSPVSVPYPRRDHALAYDGARGRIVLFGGRYQDPMLGDVALADTWEWDGVTWTDVTPATSPEARFDHAIAFDPARGKLVLFGGERGDESFDDTWEWDGTIWERVSSGPTPPARARHALAHDAVRGRVVLYGGLTDANTQLGDMWEFDGATWTQIPAGPGWPAPRDDHSLACDSGRGVVVMYGGAPVSSDVWEWNGITWRSLTPTSPVVPGLRLQHSLVADPVRGTLVLFGGIAGFGGSPLGDTWESPDGRTWTNVTSAWAPRPRWGHAMAYDPRRRRSVLFGGSGDATCAGTSDLLDDTWIWDGTGWQEIVPATRPPARCFHAMAYDVARDRLVMFGGTAAEIFGDTWEFDGVQWTNPQPATSPVARAGQAMVFDARRGRVTMVGGSSAGAPQADVWEWTGTDWVAQPPGAFVPRVFHAHAYDGARESVVVFGGLGGGGVFGNETWERTGGSFEYVPVILPSGRGYHRLAYHGPVRGSISYGGYDTTPLDEAWVFRYQRDPDETCRNGFDGDGDGAVGCADPDCATSCDPTCHAVGYCEPDRSRCGDGTCDPLETCRSCPGDCGACEVRCGDFLCDAGETATTCPGDCARCGDGARQLGEDCDDGGTVGGDGCSATCRAE